MSWLRSVQQILIADDRIRIIRKSVHEVEISYVKHFLARFLIEYAEGMDEHPLCIGEIFVNLKLQRERRIQSKSEIPSGEVAQHT